MSFGRTLGRGAFLLGCLGVTGVAAGTMVGLFGRNVFWLGAVALVALAIVPIRVRFLRSSALRRFRTAYPGKDLLITYSNSPHWQSYIEQHWLPRWGQRAVVFNRSLPWQPDEPRAALWRRHTAGDEHTPSIIILSGSPAPQAIGFFSAFRDRKHGKDAALRQAEARVATALGEPHDHDV